MGVLNTFMPLLWASSSKALPNLASLSLIRYFGFSPKGVASLSCWVTHSSFGWRVTPKWMMRREECWRIKKAYSWPNKASVTFTKSHDQTSLEWFLRKVVQFWLEGRVGRVCLIYLCMVRLATFIFSFRSSPRILSAPQRGLLAAICRIRSIVSWGILGWQFFGGYDLSFQNSLKPCRCQRSKVLGLRISKACFQFFSLLARTTKKNRSSAVKEGFLICRFKTINCWRSKAFSDINSALDLERSLTVPIIKEDLAGLVHSTKRFWKNWPKGWMRLVNRWTKSSILSWLPFSE